MKVSPTIKPVTRRRGRSGSFITEFAIVAPVLVILFAGAFEVGSTLNRVLVASQVVRNANVLVVRGIDLSNSANQQLLVRTAVGLGMNQSGTWNPNPSGNSTVILTKVYLVGPLECAAGISNWDGTQATCPNYGQYVIANRLTIGNTSRWSSQAGNPASPTDSQGNISDYNMCTNSGNIATNFPGMITLSADQYTFLAEIYADISVYQLFNIIKPPVIYLRNLS